MTESTHNITCLTLVHFDGPDARKFLQGYLTCDTSTLTRNVWIPGAFCDLKGRVVVSGWVVATAAGVDCLIHSGLAETLVQFLKVYLRFSKTKARIDEASPLDITFAAVGASLTQVFIHAPASQLHVEGPFIETLNQRNLVLITPETTGRFLPQAIGLVDVGAVAFDKGCYLGQEIVARAEHRGNVKKHLVRLQLKDNVRPPQLTIINDASRQKIGAIVQTGTRTALMVADGVVEDDTRCYIDETEVTPDTS